ncbi:MAG: trypsin-like peptidase domain-containing protein [Verrucomicrobiales bacterium]|nr:trypsin-like peptidase domain-containing protein [Verrucomicrobiales bacterium]
MIVDVRHRAARVVLLALLLTPSLALRASDASKALDLARQLNEAFVAVADSVSPAVVIIDVAQEPEDVDGDPGQANPWLNLLPKEYRDQFRKELEKRREQRPPDAGEEFNGQGSGMILSKEGDILTNHHVVEGSKRLRVRLKDGRQFDVDVKGTDRDSDLAVLRIQNPPANLPTVRFADSDQVRVGEFAIAIGAPYRLDYSVSYGHVSAKGRSNLMGGMFDQDFIQTDANINPGNSGGPLVDIEGRVIGINSMIRGLNSGIGFAIPSNLAREIATRLIEDGRFVRSWLGLQIDSLRDRASLRKTLADLKEGVVVDAISRNGPASHAEPALKPGDVITSVDGHPVADPAQLRAVVSRKRPGSTVVLDVRRAAESLKVKVQPQALPEAGDRIAGFMPRRPAGDSPEDYGIHVDRLSPEVARKQEVESGVIIQSISPDSPAAGQDLRPGDVVTEVNHQSVESPDQFQEILGEAALSKGILLQVVRDGQPGFRVLKPGKD